MCGGVISGDIQNLLLKTCLYFSVVYIWREMHIFSTHNNLLINVHSNNLQT